METGDIIDSGLWKCGKGGAFTHIPTNFIILNKINSFIIHKGKIGKKKYDEKNLINRRFWKCFLKNFWQYLIAKQEK